MICPLDEANEIKAREKAYSQDLQRDGRWKSIWRVVGEYANYSIFDVASNDELHQLLQGLPLFPFMKIHVTPLAPTPRPLPEPHTAFQKNVTETNTMKTQLLTLLAAGITLAAAPAAHAQAAGADWPNKPIRWVVPFPPGGAMDAIARTLGEKAGKALGQPFVIENKPGAGGNIGADFVAKAPADGYTMMITSIGMATNKPLVRQAELRPGQGLCPGQPAGRGAQRAGDQFDPARR